jgi:hypothetical protein
MGAARPDALADPIEWDVALSPGGAVEAAVEARDEGLIRWLASPATAPRSPRPTGAASTGSVSTRCCLPKVLDAASRYADTPVRLTTPR